MNNTDKFYTALTNNYKIAKDIFEKASAIEELDELVKARLVARIDTYEYILTLYDIFVKGE